MSEIEDAAASSFEQALSESQQQERAELAADLARARERDERVVDALSRHRDD